MQTIKLETKKINHVAQASGTTPEKFVAESRSISLGRRVCAHFQGTRGRFSIFILSEGVRTLHRRAAPSRGTRH